MIAGFEDRVKERREGRIAHLLREEISMILRKEVSDPRVRGALVTDVQLTDKMRLAKVKVCKSLMDTLEEPSLEAQEELLNGLGSAASHIQRSLRRNVELRSIPFLKFYYDKNISDASKVWGSMKEMT